MKKKHITKEERIKIEGWFEAGISQKEMAELLGRGRSTICEEIQRGMKNGIYSWEKANHRAYIKQYRKKKDCLIVSSHYWLKKFIEKRLLNGWSPEMIALRIKQTHSNLPNVSAKAIRKWIHTRARHLERFLFWNRYSKKPGRKRGVSLFLSDPERRNVKDRIIENNAYGHWEGDFIVSKHSTDVLLVLVEKKTKYTLIQKLSSRENTLVNQSIVSLLEGYEVKSLTLDNDIAFKKWKHLEQQLQTIIFFTEPYCSWQKGLVENMNRWIRLYVPKKTDIHALSEEHIIHIQAWMNNLPRIVLKGETSYEVLCKHQYNTLVTSLAVALPRREG